jgi:hypothetical protein
MASFATITRTVVGALPAAPSLGSVWSSALVESVRDQAASSSAPSILIAPASVPALSVGRVCAAEFAAV